ncbi:MAG: multiple resistance and pH regulation protein F [Candidatus Omnitrophica bacterium]|nr:multiple resistance and pH regulation protein F [Candidatus Omnitrophota bacterium]
MSNRRVRWVIGLVILLAIFAVILLYPLPILMYPGLPFAGLYRRALFIIMLCVIFCLYRIFRGPTAPDRIITIDILGILVVGFCAVLSIPTGRSWYIDIGIAWALQSFIGTLALAKYLEGKDFDE